MTQMVRWGGGVGNDKCVLHTTSIYHRKMWTCKTCGLRIPLTEVSQQQQHTRIHGMSCPPFSLVVSYLLYHVHETS